MKESTHKSTRTVLKILGGIAGICLTLVLVSAIGLWLLIDSLFPCGNDVLTDLPSPDGKYKVVVFQRDCGATTGFSTQTTACSSIYILI